jgi:hypothetical protein
VPGRPRGRHRRGRRRQQPVEPSEPDPFQPTSAGSRRPRGRDHPRAGLHRSADGPGELALRRPGLPHVHRGERRVGIV